MDQTRQIIYKEIMKLPENKSLVEYVSKFIKLSKEGTRYIGRCPFCYKENRITVFEENNRFHCYWCSKDGEMREFKKLLLELFEFDSSDLKYNLDDRMIRRMSRERIIKNLSKNEE